MRSALRASRGFRTIGFFGPDRQRLLLFLLVSAWVHLLAFSTAQRLELDPFSSAFVPIAPPERFIELDLELSSPPAPAAPEPTLVQPVAPPTAPPTPESPSPIAETDSAIYPPLSPGTEIEAVSADVEPRPSSVQDATINVEETVPRFKSYSSSVRAAVAGRWILPPEARANFQPGRFTAVMTLDRDGQVVMIFVEESSGSPSLDSAATAALWGAAPYDPFPPELAEHERLNFRLHFDYRAVVRRALPAGRQADR
jgi:TonB family protein